MTAPVAKNALSFIAPETMSRYQGPSTGVAARLTQLVDAVRQWPRRRAVLAELASLSDHELSDIGLSRADLPRVFDPRFAVNRNSARLGL